MSTLNAGTLNITGAFNLPSLTTSERDAISSPAVGRMIYNSTDGAVEVWNGEEWAAAVGASETFVTASGGSVSLSGDYKIHTFNNSTNFVVNETASDANNNKVDYLIVAGGGGGGGFASGDFNNFGSGGGGGAGGMLTAGGYNFTLGA